MEPGPSRPAAVGFLTIRGGYGQRWHVVRPRQPPSYHEAMRDGESTWVVIVKGHDRSLEQLARHLMGSVRVVRGPGGWELTASRLDVAPESDRYQVASELMQSVLGLTRVKLGTRSRSLEFGDLVEVRPDGSRKPHHYAHAGLATAAAEVVGAGVVTKPDESLSKPPEPWGPILELHERNRRVQAAFAFMALEPTWHSLYAALDVVLTDRDTKRRSVLARLRRPNPEQEVSRFKKTAGSFSLYGTDARHGDPDYPPPTKPMSLSEATAFVRDVVDAWLAELLEPRG